MKSRSEFSTPMPWPLIVFQFALSIPVLLTIPVVAAGITMMLVSPLASVAPGSALWRSVFWVSATPLIYSIWLLLCLAICAMDVQSRRWYRGLKKVPRVSSDQGITKFYPVISLYLRMRFLYSLPLTQSLLCLPGLRWLVLWSYAPSAHLGVESYILGYLFDPDLTDVGDGAIIGTGVSVVAHSLTTNPDGTKVLSTAPIVIGPRAVISGESLISLGVTIGADAIIEPLSYVPAFTQIPAGEVWGGNPAVFRRSRFETAAPVAEQHLRTTSTATRTVLERSVCSAVASALRLPVNEVSATFSCEDCREWDSLGQMAVASTLYSLTGTEIPMAQCFGLRSIPQIVEFLASKQVRQPSETREVIPANPELLPLLNHQHTSRLLAERGSAGSSPDLFPAMKVVVAATFSAEPLVSSLTLWGNAFGIPIELESAGFDQVPQALLSPESLFRRNADGVNIVLTCPEDLLDRDEDRSELLLQAIGEFASEFPNLLVVANLPPAVSADFRSEREQVVRLRNRWNHALSEINGIQVLDFAGIVERIGTTGSANADGDRIARVPYSAEVYAELGIAVARHVRYRRIPPAKVLALDADGVLWGNVLGEDGIDGISLGSEEAACPFKAFQQSVLKIRNRGVLLVMVSRNELADVKQVFEWHPGMILRSDDIAAWRVNWQPKSQNLKDIAAELNVGLNSFVFVDDDPANQLEVNSNAPEVTVLPISKDPAEYGPMLDRLWCFDAAATTDADTQRTQMMHQEHARKKHQQASMDLESYLVSLELRVEMRPATAADMSRVAQLTQKTNQFNLSLKRRSEAELSNLALDHSIFVVHVTDRFGDYGLVGVCILKCPSQPEMTIHIDTLLISCRALGRGVEEAMLHGMLNHAKSRSCRALEAELISGPRNQPVAEFLQRSGFEQIDCKRFVRSSETSVMIPSHIKWTGPSNADSSYALQTSTNSSSLIAQ